MPISSLKKSTKCVQSEERGENKEKNCVKGTRFNAQFLVLGIRIDLFQSQLTPPIKPASYVWRDRWDCRRGREPGTQPRGLADACPRRSRRLAHCKPLESQSRPLPRNQND